ncbi:hypothetical protein Syun_026186 [Stephania yunnanensis]|uniref:Uncharacterized protein n=1 Tax=Stephania yunnanensis TaxID=152371 RepID=A0AAP0ET12_9MAGN
MDVNRVLHMNGGEGEASYASNSSLQRAVITMVKPILEETILDLVSDEAFLASKVLCIADLGCSSGPNSLSVISHIVDTITTTCHKQHRQPPEFQVLLNDLPGNDFNTVIKSLPSFYDKLKRGNINHGRSCFVAAMPGSFHHRLFPRKSIHFIHSSYSLQYLSQVPKGLVSKEGMQLNKGNTYIASTTPQVVSRAYYEQFKHDFYSFLHSRSEEVIKGGRAVLTLIGRRTDDPSRDENCVPWKMITLALKDIAEEGHIEEAQIDSFNFPCYAPSAVEVQDIILLQGSFSLTRLEGFEIGWDSNMTTGNTSFDTLMRARYISKYVRAISEPMLSSHFGALVMDALFRRHIERVAELLNKEEPKFNSLVITLIRKVNIIYTSVTVFNSEEILQAISL